MTIQEVYTIIEKIVVPAIIPIAISFLTYRIAKNQIINSGVTQFRQQWINHLRSALSQFISRAEYIFIAEEDGEHVNIAYREMVEAQYQIELMLNPNENDHNDLIELLEDLRSGLYDGKLTESQFDECLIDLLACSKIVLKREWVVVKKGQ